MKLTSTAFEQNDLIPKRYTGFGEDISPELCFEDIPNGTVSLCVILEDMDVPIRGILPHWLIWNIQPANRIPGGLPAGKSITDPIPAIQGNAWGKNRYRGPKQPPFIHRAH